MPHNLVTVIMKQLTHSKIGPGITFLIDMTSRVTIHVAMSPAKRDPSPLRCPNPISIW